MPDPTTKPLRELHIGNMPQGVQQEQLKEFVSLAMLQGKLNTSEGSPCVTCRCSDKFAFAEFRTIDECNNAMTLKGINLLGRTLMVREGPRCPGGCGRVRDLGGSGVGNLDSLHERSASMFAFDF